MADITVASAVQQTVGSRFESLQFLTGFLTDQLVSYWYSVKLSLKPEPYDWETFI